MKKLIFTIASLLALTPGIALASGSFVLSVGDTTYTSDTTGAALGAISFWIDTDSYTTQNGGADTPITELLSNQVAGSTHVKFIILSDLDNTGNACSLVSYADCLADPTDPTNLSATLEAYGEFDYDDGTGVASNLVLNQAFGSGLSISSINSSFASVAENVSSVAATTILTVLAFIGLLIAAGWAWRFFKRHVAGDKLAAMDAELTRKNIEML